LSVALRKFIVAFEEIQVELNVYLRVDMFVTLQAPCISTDPFLTARLLKQHCDRYSSDEQ